MRSGSATDLRQEPHIYRARRPRPSSAEAPGASSTDDKLDYAHRMHQEDSIIDSPDPRRERE